MLLRKRPRGPIKRTTSMTGINVDLSDMEGVEAPPAIDSQGEVVAGHGGFDHRLMSTVSPRYHKKSSGGGSDHAIVETPHFLRTCGLCKRRLAPSRDIYMYRGDTAFCSQECREQQMKHDERKENCSMAASKKDENHHHHHPHPHQSTPATNTASSEA